MENINQVRREMKSVGERKEKPSEMSIVPSGQLLLNGNHGYWLSEVR